MNNLNIIVVVFSLTISLVLSFPPFLLQKHSRFAIANNNTKEFRAVSVLHQNRSKEPENQHQHVTKIDDKILRQNSPLSVMYIEVVSVNFFNILCYSLTTPTGQHPLFDIAIIFASDINWDSAQRKAVLSHNAHVRRVLDGVDTYVRPLQAKGIKVLLSILGNHQGAGICNFQDQAAARDFALQLAGAVNQYGLDGIDFDDEYAEYGNNGTGQPNPSSFILLLRELRSLIPDKIISFYFYGPATKRLSYDGMRAGDFLDYSWNAVYGSYAVPKVPGLSADQLGPAAVNVAVTSGTTAQLLAARTVKDGYGVFLYYNLLNTDLESYLSGISNRLYGFGTELEEECLQPLPGQDGRTFLPTHPANSSRGSHPLPA